MTRPHELEDGAYDVVVVGGGMAGAGVARDLALRGVSVALVEKGDFASGTTAYSSKLIHGGLRYLELFDFGLVRESLRERETLGRLAPHLVRPLPFLVPIYRESSRSLVKVRLGLKLYDWLTPGRRRERYRVLPAIDALSLEPAIRAQDLRGAGYYFDDLLVYPERLALENVLSAHRHGARAFNYAQVDEVLRDARGEISGVRVRDFLSDRVARLHARIVVNATGPWVDDLRALAGVDERGKRILRRTKGIHCLLPRLTERAVYHSTSDDRMIFVIPWRDFSLIGTTDTDFEGDLDRLHATRDEVQYLLGEVRHVLSDPRVAVEHVAYTYAGVRPLSFEEGRRESEVSRAHEVVAEERGRFLSITGTKLTCFRSLAEELGDRVVRALGRKAPGRTGRLTLDGADEEVGGVEARAWLDVSAEMATSGLPRETLETLVTVYGRGYRRVLDLAGKLAGGAERLCPSNPDIVAQLHLAVQDELTVSLQDVLLRRTGLGTSGCQGLDCAEAIGARMARLLGWSPRRLAAELDAYQAYVARSHRFKTP
ncbi:MAG: glycerol-3-phosphate dehydrogenase/oxidase [Candidatus Rokubacteria bacterium]|nr:glycerol-3-phosphate dehydrogenase/oxidase [Candidatus Rokubacteria bacterium]MBI4628164.1 glycerol-3-phosphate dehydrogenase/oxidase [Candidatus Rokubacteria bacterium]